MEIPTPKLTSSGEMVAELNSAPAKQPCIEDRLVIYQMICLNTDRYRIEYTYHTINAPILYQTCSSKLYSVCILNDLHVYLLPNKS